MAIVALIVAPIPFGIVAVIKAASVWTHWSAGRDHEARRAARSARNWSIAGFAAVALLIVVPMTLGLVLAVGAGAL